MAPFPLSVACATVMRLASELYITVRMRCYEMRVQQQAVSIDISR